MMRATFLCAIVLTVSGVPVLMTPKQQAQLVELASTTEKSEGKAVPPGAQLSGFYGAGTDHDEAHSTLAKTINQLNLVMAHDAGTYPVEDHGITDPATCQASNLANQFEAGVRVFDIRVLNSGEFFHNWALFNKIYSEALPALKELQAAVKAKGSFAILVVKGYLTEIRNALAEDAGAYFDPETFDAEVNNVTDLEGKVVVLKDGEKGAGSWEMMRIPAGGKLQLAAITTKLNPGVDNIDKMSSMHEAWIHKGNCAFSRASFSNTGVFQSPLCKTVESKKRIVNAASKIFLSGCPSIVSLDAADLVIGTVPHAVAEDCGQPGEVGDEYEDAMQKLFVANMVEQNQRAAAKKNQGAAGKQAQTAEPMHREAISYQSIQEFLKEAHAMDENIGEGNDLKT